MGEERRPFGSWRLHGGRYDKGGLPVEVLSEFARYERLITDVARGLYMKGHRSRQRVPRGFSSAFSLRLSAINQGSVIPVLEVATPSGASLFEDELFTIFDEARFLIEETLRAVCAGKEIPASFPRQALSEFSSFGRSLREDEFLEFEPGTPHAVTYSQAIRRSLQAAAQLDRFELETLVNGQVIGILADRQTFEFRLATNNKTVQGHFASEDMVPDLTRFLGKSKMAPTVALNAVALLSASDEIIEIADVLAVEPVLPAEWSERLAELSRLEAGWLDGSGVEVVGTVLRQAELILLQLLDDGIERPRIFPSENGGVQFEWSLPNGNISLDITADRTLELYGYAKSSEEELEAASSWADAEGVFQKLRVGIDEYS